jgi:hypothetical protein
VYNQAFNLGRISQNETIDDKREESVRVQCFPFFSILSALDQTQIDYFSLDIEGDEFTVLKTIPWDRVDIKVKNVVCPIPDLFQMPIIIIYLLTSFLRASLSLLDFVSGNRT